MVKLSGSIFWYSSSKKRKENNSWLPTRAKRLGSTRKDPFLHVDSDSSSQNSSGEPTDWRSRSKVYPSGDEQGGIGLVYLVCCCSTQKELGKQSRCIIDTENRLLLT